MCKESYTVCQVNEVASISASIIIHEIGHLFGMYHDSGELMMTQSTANISELLAVCEGSLLVIVGRPSQRPVTLSFDVFLECCSYPSVRHNVVFLVEFVISHRSKFLISLET